MTAFNDNNITYAGRCDINLCTPKPVPFQHRHHLHRQQTFLHAHQKPGIKTPANLHMGWAFIFEFYPERKRGVKYKNIKAQHMCKFAQLYSCNGLFRF
jgi:hypothetical protein